MVAVAPTRERVLKRKGKLPVPPETSHRLKSGVVMELINDYLTQERPYESTN